MLRWFGAALILAGGLLARKALLSGERRAQQTRRELAAELEAMETEIRLLLTPFPALLRRDHAESARAFFDCAAAELESGAPLPEAWRRAADTLPLPDGEKRTLESTGARLGGGEESVCAALSLTAAMLRRNYERAEQRRAEKERLTTSICVSISLFLAILLL